MNLGLSFWVTSHTVLAAMKSFAIALFLFAACFNYLSAQLVFEQTTIEHTASVEESKFVAVFKFHNQGDSVVEVMEPSSSCGCTVPRLEKSSYEPGETGQISAVFSYGTRSGLQRKSVTVPTSAGAHRLELVVEIPLRYSLDVRLLHWQKSSDDLQSKEATFEFHVDRPVELISQTLGESAYAYEIKSDPETGRFVVSVRPTEDTPTGIIHSDWEFKTASGKIYTIPLYLRVF